MPAQANWGPILFGALWVLSCGAPKPSPEAAPQPPEQYAGEWWLAQTDSRRYGFVVGIVDCFFGDVGGTSVVGDSAYAWSVRRVTAHYGQRATHDQPALFAVLGASFSRSESGRRADWHENWTGNYWLEMASSAGEQLGYLEGYLACYHTFVPHGRARFARPPAAYVAALGAWYRIDPKTMDRDGEREAVPIAEALGHVATTLRE